MRLFDAHCQPQFPQYDEDRDAVLDRMQKEEIGGLVIGTDYEMSKAGVSLANTRDFLWASVGLHPNQDEVFDPDKYEELARDPKVVAIGECGLDYFRSKPDSQKEKFEAQLALAQKLTKPVIVHCREAHDDCAAVLQKANLTVPVVMHFFTGTAQLAQSYLDLGCYLSFPGPITYTDRYDESVRVCPLDRLFSETDAPFAAPVPHRGKRNEPSYVAFVAQKMALLKGISVDALGAATIENAQKIFGLR